MISKHKVICILISIYIVIVLGGFAAEFNHKTPGLINIFKVLSQVNFINSTDLTLVKNVANIYQSCNSSQFWNKCYSNQLVNLNEQNLLSQAIKSLRLLQILDKRAIDCHQIAHQIARSETQKNITNWQDVLQSIDPYLCQGGLIHEFLEERVNPEEEKEYINSYMIEKICRRNISCIKITGGILLVDQEGRVGDAIKVCQNLKVNLITPCLEGVFEENVTRTHLEIHKVGRLPTQDDKQVLERYCQDQQDKTVSIVCWKEMAHFNLSDF